MHNNTSTTDPGAKPSSRRYFLRLAALTLPPVASILGRDIFVKSEREMANEERRKWISSLHSANNHPRPNNNVPLGSFALTPANCEEISRWMKSPPILPAADDLYTKAPNTSQWLESASSLNTLLVLKIRSQIQALSAGSAIGVSTELQNLNALLLRHPLAFRIASNSSVDATSPLTATYFYKDITHEFSRGENKDYNHPNIYGIRYAKSTANPNWPRRWPEYLISRLESLVQLHEALLLAQSSRTQP
jgi:hypothetical protein